MSTGFELALDMRHVLLVQTRIHGVVHIIGVGGTLGIDIEHHKRRKTMALSNALNGFDRVIQSLRRCGAGIDTKTKQRIVALGTEREASSIIGRAIVEPLHMLRSWFGTFYYGEFQRE